LRQQRASHPVDVAAAVKNLFGVPQPYLIGAGDVLNIMVWDHPELTIAAAGSLATDAGSLSPVGNGFNVSPQGFVQFPYVGKLKLGGLTEYEARDLLTQRLAKTIKDPQVTVRIQSFRSGRVYLDGEVRTPGLQAINDVPMTLPEAIGRAGGFTPAADRSAIVISRKGITTMVNMVQLSEQGINPASILLVNGDLVRVLAREEAKVFVLGEVSRPSTQTLRNGRLTLGEALGESGGVNPASGDPRQIFVVRAASAEQPEIYHLDARSPVAFALAEGFELQARDVVYVDPVPLVRWNRVISLILPSAQAVTTTQSIIR
jgi:polysaccharide export outer membrane protein